jgi:integrase
MHLAHFLMNHQPPIAKFGTHDLRRTVATTMAETLGISLEIIARVIGHTGGSASTRTLIAHYVRADFIEQKQTALLAWDAHLRAIIAAEPAPSYGNVVKLASMRITLP